MRMIFYSMRILRQGGDRAVLAGMHVEYLTYGFHDFFKLSSVPATGELGVFPTAITTL